ncbi:MAG: hypothetical protein COB46_12855 [Rhodospirillaceae bacterium]|nr:MAG: hypothetical protein COB46_12855 [Rhodospirillaceae bacterium]
MQTFKGITAFYKGLGGGLSFLLLVLFAPPLKAEAPRLFTVKGVNVDVTADSAQAARIQAQKEGELKSFTQLLKRLTLSAYHDRLPTLPLERIRELIQDFAVTDEKASSVRYIANMDYRYRAPQIRTILNDAGIPYAETKSKPVLMLPVYQSAGALLLWDDPNPWRTAWQNMGNQGDAGLVPMVLPIGDLEDIRTIGAEQAMEGDAQRLAAMTNRYQTGDVVVAHGILRMDAGYGLPELEVYLTRFGSALQEHTVVKSFTAIQGEDVSVLLSRSVVQLKDQVEDNWKQDNLIQAGQAQVLPLQVRVADLKGWVRVRDRLNGVAIIQHADVVLMRQGEVHLNLNFIGDAEQLALSLEQADLMLWEEAGSWYLGLRSAVQ